MPLFWISLIIPLFKFSETIGKISPAFSIIVTFNPSLLNASAASKPINPAPTIIAFFNLSLFLFKKSLISKAFCAWDNVKTFSKSFEYPVILGMNDFPPTAIINLS